MWSIRTRFGLKWWNELQLFDERDEKENRDSDVDLVMMAYMKSMVSLVTRSSFYPSSW